MLFTWKQGAYILIHVAGKTSMQFIDNQIAEKIVFFAASSISYIISYLQDDISWCV